ncbi:MAG: MATE family efflux transporter [Paludibacteraceae bacterium]|nr:MATE family efflux transporter [Paludibacteraceae bacterium]
MIDRTKELGTEPIGSLLWLYALPSVISQVISSVYNLADRMFIGQGVGALAIAGLAITMPIMNVVHAFGSLIGAGSAARISIVLGKKDYVWAEKILGNSTVFTIIFGAVIFLFGYTMMDPILHAFGATDDTIAYAREYMYIVLPGMVLTTVTFNLVGLIRATGYPHKAMYILAGGAILNIILDPIFIFKFDWGIAGAAWATTISMATTAVISVVHFIKPSSFIRFKRHAWAPKGYIFKNITMIGLSPFLMNICTAGVVAILNIQLIRYGGDMAVGAYGIINTYGMFIFMFIFGICMGMQPIAGYNYGAGNFDRLSEIYKLTSKVCMLLGLVGSLVGCIFPEYIMRAFTTDSSLIEIGSSAMIYWVIMFPLIGFTVVNSEFFQSIDKQLVSIITSLSRQLIFLLPLCFALPQVLEEMGYDGLTGVWLSGTISDVLGATLAAVLLYSQRHVFYVKE